MCVCLQFISVLKVITVPSILWEALHCNINMQMNANPGHKKYSFYHGGEPVHFSSPSLSLNAEELRSFLHKAVQHLESALPLNNLLLI